MNSVMDVSEGKCVSYHVTFDLLKTAVEAVQASRAISSSYLKTHLTQMDSNRQTKTNQGWCTDEIELSDKNESVKKKEL